MKFGPIIRTTGAALVGTAVYLTGYYHGSVEMAEELKPRIVELRAKTIETKEMTSEIHALGNKIDDLQSLVRLKEEQLATPVMLPASEVHFNRGTRVGKFVISAYSPYDDRNYINSDGNPNDTATGTTPKPGTMAVDPKVIPYGSKITILYPDGTMERGVAEDTGGAIKNNRIDVFRYSFDTAMDFGKQEAIVIWQ